jgi:hypothetical protein
MAAFVQARPPSLNETSASPPFVRPVSRICVAEISSNLVVPFVAFAYWNARTMQPGMRAGTTIADTAGIGCTGDWGVSTSGPPQVVIPTRRRITPSWSARAASVGRHAPGPRRLNHVCPVPLAAALSSYAGSRTFIGLSCRTLEKYRIYGTGPKYSKIGGRIVYAVSDLREWVELGAKRSTSDPATVLPAKPVDKRATR